MQNAFQSAVESSLSSQAKNIDADALRLLIPRGYRVCVELRQNHRKKRGNASADRWSPEDGEIVVHCIADTATALAADVRGDSYSAAVTPVHELCAVLEEAERSGRPFIALKWFRDTVLAGRGFAWAQSAADRQAVLAQAIEQGAVVTRKIPNPQTPQFPTTTISLNRSHGSSSGAGFPRYQPVPVQGESLSGTLLHDRGAR